MYKSVKEFFNEKQPLWATLQASYELAFINLLSELGLKSYWTDEEVKMLKTFVADHTKETLKEIEAYINH